MFRIRNQLTERATEREFRSRRSGLNTPRFDPAELPRCINCRASGAARHLDFPLKHSAMHRLSQYINSTVRISSPGVFADSAAHACTLVAVDDDGVWLQSEELNRLLYSTREFEPAEYGAPVFVPYAQIAFLIPAIVSVGGTHQADILRQRHRAAGSPSANPVRAGHRPDHGHPSKSARQAKSTKPARRPR